MTPTSRPASPTKERRAAKRRGRGPRVPSMMRAAALDRFGGPGELTLHELPVPELDSDEVLIAVDVAGVGSWDAEMRGGWWPEGRPRFPLVLGSDGAGTVAAPGSRVRRFKLRERVYAYAFASKTGGFYAEYVAVPASHVAPVPRGLDLLQAGALAATGLTALQGIDDRLRVKRGEDVIVLGASGGVGTLAVQFAKRAGARVLAIASGRDGVGLVRALGADEAVDGRRADIEAAANRFAPEGADALLALAGGKPCERCLDALRPGGRAAYPNGVEPEPRKRRDVSLVSYDATPGVREFQRLNRAVEEAQLEVPIAAEYSLDRASRAHERLERGHVPGRIVLRIR